MFNHDFAESSKSEIDIFQVSAPILRKIVNYFYTGEIEISNEEAPQLLLASWMLQVPELDCFVMDVLLQNVSPELALEVFNTFRSFECGPTATATSASDPLDLARLSAAGEFQGQADNVKE
jgi:hypothetical protein